MAAAHGHRPLYKAGSIELEGLLGMTITLRSSSTALRAAKPVVTEMGVGFK
jgi:hypothetical protein